MNYPNLNNLAESHPTLENIELPRTLQEVFDRVVDWFVVGQHKKSKLRKNQCAYRSADSACAIGCVVPNRYININNNDGADIRDLMDSIINSVGEKIKSHPFFNLGVSAMDSLQTAHDRSYSSEDFVDALRSWAKQYRLDTSTLDSLSDHWVWS